MIDLALLITAAMFGFYGLASALECGVGLALLDDRDSVRARRLFTPFWEITNVFLVFGVTAIAVLFNNSLQPISHALISTLAVGLIGLLLRGCVVLRIFYINHGRLSQLEASVFALCNYAIPLSFSAAGAYLLTGEYFWRSWPGFLLVGATALGLSAIGLSFVSLASTKLRPIADLAVGAWALVLGCVLPLAIIHTSNNLKAWPVAVLAGLGFVSLLALVADSIVGVRKLVLSVVVTTGLAAPLLLAWANRPYFISGKLALTQAYGAQAYGSVVVAGLLLSLPLILFGFLLFYKLSRPQHG